MSSWELVGAIAYTQAFALLESLLVLLCLLAFGAILPARLLRERFATVGSMLVFLTAAWAMLAQYNSNELGLWGPKDYLPWLALYLVSIAGPYLLIRSHKRMEGAIASLVERLTVLSAFYVIVGLLSILFVVSRNIA
jgi:hypothetical protein